MFIAIMFLTIIIIVMGVILDRKSYGDGEVFFLVGIPACIVSLIASLILGVCISSSWVVDDNDNVIGYLSYQIYCVTDTVHKFGLISFDKGNPIIGRDLFKKLRELVNQHHKIEWRVVGGNPVKKHYDKFCKKYNGYIHHFHDSDRDLNGNLVDSYLYEIINDKR